MNKTALTVENLTKVYSASKKSKSEKALNKALDIFNTSTEKEFQPLSALIVENQEKLIESTIIDTISHIPLLINLYKGLLINYNNSCFNY